MLYTPSSSAFSRVDLPWKPPPTMRVMPRLSAAQRRDSTQSAWPDALRAPVAGRWRSKLKAPRAACAGQCLARGTGPAASALQHAWDRHYTPHTALNTPLPPIHKHPPKGGRPRSPDAQPPHRAPVGQAESDRQGVWGPEGDRLARRHGLITGAALPAARQRTGSDTVGLSGEGCAGIAASRAGQACRLSHRASNCRGSQVGCDSGRHQAGVHLEGPESSGGGSPTWAGWSRPPQMPPAPARAAGPAAPQCPPHTPHAPAGRGGGGGGWGGWGLTPVGQRAQRGIAGSLAWACAPGGAGGGRELLLLGYESAWPPWCTAPAASAGPAGCRVGRGGHT